MPVNLDALFSGQRRALAKAITLIESTRASDRTAALSLLNACLPRSGASFRLGISGVPGVGKSTFIETFGQQLIQQGHRVCVLAVDPSSPKYGGSILGDKTRMERLSRADEAFIRPSPAGITLGGVAQRTRESILLAEAAGYDIILVETVGVGQSEHDVASMTDCFLVLMQPGAGDELQGIKKGILELADFIVVNKADGALAQTAEQTRIHYKNALGVLTHSGFWTPDVHLVSATTGLGIVDLWEHLKRYQAAAEETRDARRQQQALDWFTRLIDEGIQHQLLSQPRWATALSEARERVTSAQQTPPDAAASVLSSMISQLNHAESDHDSPIPQNPAR